MAPRITYAADSQPRDRLLALLAALHARPERVLSDQAAAAAKSRLAAYWLARDQFIAAGRTVKASGDVKLMLQQVQAPLLAALRLSPDFRPAYEPLVKMAVVQGRTDPIAARALLGELEQLQPAWPEAVLAIQALDDP